MKYQILLVEDDGQIREVIKDYFSAQKEDEVEVVCARDGYEGMEKAAETPFDLAILDVMLPDMDGFVLCREIRKTDVVPIIFLTARGSEEDKLRGYLSGCDDYIVKPFSLVLLYAKVRALIKREKGMVIADTLRVGEIELNPADYTIWVSHKQIETAPKEYALLKYMMERKNQILTREELLIRIWGYDFEGSDRVVDNHIKKLRKRLGKEGARIKTVVKKGYKLID